jgi:hypothetical protein
MGTQPVFEVVAADHEEIVVRDHGAPGGPQDFSLQLPEPEALAFTSLVNEEPPMSEAGIRIHIRSIATEGSAHLCSLCISSGKSRQTKNIAVSSETFEKLQYVFRWRAMDWELRAAIPTGVTAR